jgi:hypothetical protein
LPELFEPLFHHEEMVSVTTLHNEDPAIFDTAGFDEDVFELSLPVHVTDLTDDSQAVVELLF